MDDTLTLLVDAPSLVFRALFSTPDSVTTPDGAPINAAHGFLRMLARLVADQNPDFICCADDHNWRPQWRVDLVGSYKAHRAESGSAQEQAEERLGPQLPIIMKLLDLCGVRVLGHSNYEAEDVIGTLARRAPGRVAIFSGDRDLFQLVKDPQCFVIYPLRGTSEIQIVDEAYIESRYGIPGRAYLDYAVLRGDPSDGLPGVKGIGDKLAASLLQRYGSLDGIVEAAKASQSGLAIEKVGRALHYIERARRVVAIATNVPLPDVDLARPGRLPEDAIIATAEAYGLVNPVRALLDALR